MRTGFASALLVLAAAMPSAAVLVDGVAITAGAAVITRSAIDHRILLTAFQNGETPNFSLDARREAAQRLLDQKLVEREMEVGHYPRMDAKAKEDLVTDYEKTNYKSDPEAFSAALKKYGLTREDLADELGLQTGLLTFLNLRFRPAVQVTDQDIQKYFDEHYANGAENTKQSAQTGALNEMRGLIEQKLTGERAAKELDSWLTEQRRRVAIAYQEKDLAPEGNKTEARNK